jgi:hypothetical protein
MPCSERKLEANRRNAQLSTGPKSPEGKAIAARNSTRHGLRAEEVVLPGEDADAFDRSLGAWMADFKPPTEARAVLVEQAAAHAWRLRRCLKAERDHLEDRGDEAVRRLRRDAFHDVSYEAENLRSAPARSLAALLRNREGVAWLIGEWGGLLALASGEDWRRSSHHRRLMNLMGRSHRSDPREEGAWALASYRLVLHNDRKMAEADTIGAGRPEAAEADALGETLAAFIAGRVAELRRALESGFPAEDAELARAASSGLLDDTDEGRRLLRYEEMHGRAFRATLNQLVKLTKSGDDLVVGDGPSEAQPIDNPEVIAEVTPTPVGPDAAATAPNGPNAAAPNEPTESATAGAPAPNGPTEAAPNEPTATASRAPGREREGRVWEAERAGSVPSDRYPLTR